MKRWFGLILMLIMTNANASVITVGPTGCEYSSIQTAIDAAESGDIIQVQSGAYYENVDVNKQLTLLGIDTGTGKPVVDAKFSGSSFILNADGIVIAGFAATNSEDTSSSTCAAGVYVYSNHNIIRNNDFVNNIFGIRLVQSRDNVIISNNVSNNGFGIDLDRSINNTITQNIIEGNYQCAKISVDLGEGQHCSPGDGIRLKDSGRNNITYNEIENNCEGIALESSHLNTIIHNEMSFNLGNIDLRNSLNNIINPNRITEYYADRGSGIDFCEAGDGRRSGYKHQTIF